MRLLTALGLRDASLFLVTYWSLTALAVAGMHVAAGPLAAVVSTAWCLGIFTWGVR